MNCPLCDTILTRKISTVFFECPLCLGLVRDSSCFLSEKEEEAYYRLHNNDVHDERYRAFTSPITEHVLAHYMPEHEGLDFGCGTGPVISRVLTEKGYPITPYDPFFRPDASALNRPYNYIVCCEVFEHFRQPRIELQRLSGLLKPDGTLLIMTLLYHESIPFGNWFYARDPTHVFLYRKETFDHIARTTALRVDRMEGRLIILKKRPDRHEKDPEIG